MPDFDTIVIEVLKKPLNFSNKKASMARDKYHNDVRDALQSDGWIITHDPYYINADGINYPVDLGAEKIIAAEKEGHKIAVEIKSFLAESLVNEFHGALGQYLDYEMGLEEQEPDRNIFLAIPSEVWDRIQRLPFLLKVLEKFGVDLIIFEPDKNNIVQWIKR